MSDADVLALLTIALCLIASMFFSSSETAITSFGERRARQLMEEGTRQGRIMSFWVREPVRVLSTILVGNNLVNTLLGSVITAFAIRHLADGEYGRYAVPIAVVAATGILLIFGEITPKAFGRLYSQRFAVPALMVLAVLARIMSPVIWLLTQITNSMLPKAARQDDVPPFHRVTQGELDYLVKVGQEEGSIPAEQAALLRGIFRFEDKVVRDIMVPRDRLTAVDLCWDVNRVQDLAASSGHSRMPVYEGNLDTIRGILHIKQLVGRKGQGPEVLREVVRPPMFVSESLLIQDLLRRFKEQRIHLAIVVDDAGHTVGVVTLEDVLEQIVGQIFDETDRAPQQLGNDGMGPHYLDGQASLRTVEELLGIELEEMEGVSSIGDLLTQLAGQIPIAGSVVVWDGLRFKVLAADDRHVIRVSVEQMEIEEPEHDWDARPRP